MTGWNWRSAAEVLGLSVVTLVVVVGPALVIRAIVEDGWLGLVIYSVIGFMALGGLVAWATKEGV